MIYNIQSDKFQVSIHQSGLELSSIKHKKTGTEYLWQGDSNYWTGQAPVLFPIIGALKNGTTLFDGKPYQIPKHGIIRHSTKAKVTEHLDDSITFQFHWDEETLHQFPFRFIFNLSFSLKGNQLNVTHTIHNADKEPMPYQLGAHPAFNCPLNNQGEYSDYFLEFPVNETAQTWLIDDNGLLTDSTEPIFDSSKILRLHNHLFDNDALIFKDLNSKSVTLKSDELGEILRVDFDDFPYLGIWAKPGAPFICIEPWHGITDHQNTDGNFLSKEKLRFLEPENEETLGYQITLFDQ